MEHRYCRIYFSFSKKEKESSGKQSLVVELWIQTPSVGLEKKINGMVDVVDLASPQQYLRSPFIECEMAIIRQN